jgi:hypothetical protein
MAWASTVNASPLRIKFFTKEAVLKNGTEKSIPDKICMAEFFLLLLFKGREGENKWVIF